jgi:hypothetical protein
LYIILKEQLTNKEDCLKDSKIMNHKTMKSTQNRKGKSATKEKGLKDMSKAKPKETSAMG